MSDTIMTVDYDCCGATYTFPVALRPDQTLLRNAALGSTLLGYADATHDVEHPECLPVRDGA